MKYIFLRTLLFACVAWPFWTFVPTKNSVQLVKHASCGQQNLTLNTQTIQYFQHFGSHSFCENQSDANEYLFHRFPIFTSQFMDTMSRIFFRTTTRSNNWVHFWCNWIHGPAKFHAALCHEPRRHPEGGPKKRAASQSALKLQKWFCAATWGFSEIGVPPSSTSSWDFPDKPFSYGGKPIHGKSHMLQKDKFELLHGYGSKPMVPYLGGWTSIYNLFWCSLGYHGFDPWLHVFCSSCGPGWCAIDTFWTDLLAGNRSEGGTCGTCQGRLTASDINDHTRIAMWIVCSYSIFGTLMRAEHTQMHICI